MDHTLRCGDGPFLARDDFLIFRPCHGPMTRPSSLIVDIIRANCHYWLHTRLSPQGRRQPPCSLMASRGIYTLLGFNASSQLLYVLQLQPCGTAEGMTLPSHQAVHAADTARYEGQSSKSPDRVHPSMHQPGSPVTYPQSYLAIGLASSFSCATAITNTWSCSSRLVCPCISLCTG